jgi:hypothetical protein
MEAMTVRKFKVFWAWGDDKEEAWLREMSLKGLHLSPPLIPCVYTFTRGEPRDDAYRLDYVPRMSRNDFAAYLQVFRDAGWEHLGEMAGWQYFRKPVQAGEAPEIFTDPESKIQKYKRLLGYLVICTMPMFILSITRIGDRPRTPIFEAFNAGVVLIFLGLIYGLARIAWRIRQLRRL